MADHTCIVSSPNVCLLSPRDYFLQLSETAKRIYARALRRLGEEDAREITSMYYPSMYDVEIAFPSLHGFKRLYLETKVLTVDHVIFSSKENSRSVHLRFLSELMAMPELNIFHLELLLWSAVSTDNSVVLDSVLSKYASLISNCLIAAALRKSIESRSVSLVRVFLQRGCPLNDNIGDGNCRGALMSFCNPNVEIAQLTVHPRDEQSNAICQIIALMLKHGAMLHYLSKRRRKSRFFEAYSDLHCPLDYLSLLALRSSDAAKYLVKASEAHWILRKTHNIDRLSRFNVMNTSPLHTALLDTAAAAILGPKFQRIQKVARLLKCCLLPLIRSGGKVERDLIATSGLAEFKLLLRFSNTKNTSNSLNSTYFNIIVEVNETRMPPRCLSWSALNRHNNRLDENNIKHLDSFAALLERCFPRKLVFYCRSVILDVMPIGYAKRCKAIKSLHLPSCLENFLLFNELD